MGRSGSLVIGAVLIAGGAGVAAYGATRPPATPGGSDPALKDVAAAIDGRLREARAGLSARAQTLADLPRLAAAVATDAATVRDLTGEERAFKLGERETIELGQSVNGKASTLLRLPEDAPMSPHLGTPGTYLGASGDALILTEVRAIKPDDRKDGTATTDVIGGAIAVSWSLDVRKETEPVRERGARIDTSAGALVIGKDPGKGTSIALTTVPAVLVVLPVAGAGASARDLGWLLWAGTGAAALGLILLALGLRRAASPAAATGATTDAVNAMGATLLSQGMPAQPGTPPPSGDGLGRPMSRTPAPGEGTNPAGGPIFGRYQLVRKLGSGGMADVFLARAHGEAGFSKQVALKLLHSHLASRPQAMAHFLDEARLASNLNHPNIVHVIDLGKVDNDYFIAMEYIEGSDLERVIQIGRAGGRHVPLPIAMTILRRVCDGLDAAHRAVGPDGEPLTIVHRDVKSGNVLVSRQGQVKISDFGIAKASTQVHTTQIGETKGTPSVMAPEQRMGQVVDLRADVYAVAALGYELFTSAEMNLDLVQLSQLGIDGWPHLPPPSEVRSDLPRELDGVLLGALAFAPDARPGSCHELEEALAAIAARYNLSATDKDIARWLEGELAKMQAPTGAMPAPSPPMGAAGR